jgi:hypothetical protein
MFIDILHLTYAYFFKHFTYTSHFYITSLTTHMNFETLHLRIL